MTIREFWCQLVAPTKVATLDPKPTPSFAALPEEVEFEFSDLVKLVCQLCARQFKSIDQLKKHNKESDLHKVWGPCFLYATEMLTSYSATLKTQTYEMWRGGKLKPLEPLLSPTAPKLLH